ncbi:MAG: hypothetical protein ACFBSC_17740 [Microcoleaceae cyanobacterium]
MNQNPLNLNRVSQWLNQRQIRLVDEAYMAAQEIMALEVKYFEGGKISSTAGQSKTIFDYVKSLRDRQLFKIRVNLAQFQTGEFFLDRKSSELSDFPGIENSQQEAELITKLDFIESVIGKYRDSEDDLEQMIAGPGAVPANLSKQRREPVLQQGQDIDAKITDPAVARASSGNSQTGFFGLRKELTPEYEQRVVQELRLRRKQDKIATRWLFILMLVPILVQISAKNFIFEPLFGHYTNPPPDIEHLNEEIKENFFEEFNRSRESLELDELLGITPVLSVEERKERLKENAVDLWREAKEEKLNGLKNLLADSTAVLAFAGLIYFNRNKIMALRSSSNRTFLELRDPAKVFLFILLTDMFVGFHSAEGWEVLLEVVAHHFGLPENESAINLFIATVPVIMDSCIKFWIFNYLTRYSPSTSAIYERMNT